MRIQFGIGIRMVDTVHDAVRSWAQVGRTLRKPGEKEKESLPTTAHVERFVSGITVLKKGLGKQG